MGLFWTALLLAVSAVAAPAEARASALGSRCWGVPQGARPVGDPEAHRFEVRDELPGPPSPRSGGPDRADRDASGSRAHLIAPGRPFSGAMWVPLAEPAEADRFVLRSLPDHRFVTTPDGAFDLTVAPLRAVRTGTREDGLLVCLAFDPAGRGEAAYPLPEVFGTARELGMLSDHQRHALAELDRVVASRWRGLQQAWEEFTLSPYLPASRRRLFDRLLGFHDPQPAFTAEALAPERFFDRGQRVRLRSKGHEIHGRCSVWVGAHRVDSYQAKVQLEACPLSQLAQAWNHLARQHGGPHLGVEGDQRAQEVDSLHLEAVGLSEAAAWKLVLGTLTGLPGVVTAKAP